MDTAGLKNQAVVRRKGSMKPAPEKRLPSAFSLILGLGYHAFFNLSIAISKKTHKF
jgi:hypothetical protein